MDYFSEITGAIALKQTLKLIRGHDHHIAHKQKVDATNL